MQVMQKCEGILVGVIMRKTGSYRYVVIPRDRIDIDVLWTVLPDSVKLYRVKSPNAVVEFLEGLYVGEFYYKISFTRRGPMYKAVLGDKAKLVRIDIDNPLKYLKKIDEHAEYYAFQGHLDIGPNFLIELSRSTGTGVGLPLRFLATQLALHICETNTTVIMNFREAYWWMKKNPHKLRGLALLPSYRFGIIVAEPVTEEELRENIVHKINESIMEFELDYVIDWAKEARELFWDEWS